ncbi:MAG TPA: SgcJ/EcaC family oxidoreductase [Noviherbaspirillum sp.]|nr:SgcJ/EcaC family oxidoreductase [Noviherbaspirillum sp.]
MLTENRNAQAEADIRALMNEWTDAFMAKDVNRIIASYTQDVVAFDAILKLQFLDRESYRKHWEACMAMCPGPVEFELRDLRVTAAEQIAFAHYICRCGGTDDKGETHSSWMRASLGLRREQDRWLIAHEHFSSPFDPATGKAMFDVTP